MNRDQARTILMGLGIDDDFEATRLAVGAVLDLLVEDQAGEPPLVDQAVIDEMRAAQLRHPGDDQGDHFDAQLFVYRRELDALRVSLNHMSQLWGRVEEVTDTRGLSVDATIDRVAHLAEREQENEKLRDVVKTQHEKERLLLGERDALQGKLDDLLAATRRVVDHPDVVSGDDVMRILGSVVRRINADAGGVPPEQVRRDPAGEIARLRGVTEDQEVALAHWSKLWGELEGVLGMNALRTPDAVINRVRALVEQEERLLNEITNRRAERDELLTAAREVISAPFLPADVVKLEATVAKIDKNNAREDD